MTKIEQDIYIQYISFLQYFLYMQVCTLPEYIHKRFGGHRIRVFLALLSLLLYIFTKISVSILNIYLFGQDNLQDIFLSDFDHCVTFK